jgi:hypothetical protein
MKKLTSMLYLGILISFSSCRAHCGCPMAANTQKNTTCPQVQTDGNADWQVIEPEPIAQP